MEIFNLLAAPFSPTAISWRVGATSGDKQSGIALAYLNARDVMARLDDVVGATNWQCRYPFAGCCELSLKLDGEWITKTNCADETDVEGVKGQASTAFKRAAVLFGVGRYLYDLPNKWYPIKQRGRSYVFTDGAHEQMTNDLAEFQKRFLTRFRNDAERKKYIVEITRRWGANDPHGLRELWDELDTDQHADIWREFNSVQRREMKEMLNQTKEEAA